MHAEVPAYERLQEEAVEATRPIDAQAILDREADLGTYFEPNVWMRRLLGTGGGL